MKVRELIKDLERCDPDSRVVVPGYEFGIDDLGTIGIVFLELRQQDPGAYYAGIHNDVIIFGGEQPPKEQYDEAAILLKGRHGDLNYLKLEDYTP